MDKIKTLFSKEELKTKILPATLGAVLIALGTNLFLMPGELLAGGLSGIALIVNYLVGLPQGIGLMILNIPMAIIAIRKIGLKFTIQSLYIVLVLSGVQLLTRPLKGALGVNDLLMNAIFGGVITGLGTGLIYRYGLSSMGTDVLAFLARRKYNINLGTFTMGFNLLLLMVSSYFFGVNLTLYTTISLYINVKIADNIMMGSGEVKNCMIVTKNYEEMVDRIFKSMRRGVTMMDAEGAYSKEKTKLLFIVLSNREIAKIRQIVNEVDENAFVTISDSIEVKGNGFRSVD